MWIAVVGLKLLSIFQFCSCETTTVSSPNSARPINRSRTGWNRSRAASEGGRACRHRRDIARRRRKRRRRHHRRRTTITAVAAARMQCRCWESWSSCRPIRTTARWPRRRRGTRPSSAEGAAAAGGADMSERMYTTSEGDHGFCILVQFQAMLAN